MKKVLIATSNTGKFEEFYQVLKDLKLKSLTLNDLDCKSPITPQEIGKTFKENAIIKAKFWGEKTGFLTLGDDSGLAVDYLGGKPGVESHRWVEGTDKDRWQKLLIELQDVPMEKRSAQFTSVVALFDPGSKNLTTKTGVCHGKIGFKPRGSHGFGYDPVFIVDELGKSFAELTPEEKSRYSHRAKALHKIRPMLLSYIKE